MDHTKRPVVEALRKFQTTHPTSFHVPGHKHGLLSGLPDDFKQVLQYDLTELTGLDDLHAPSEMLAEAQVMLSDVYGTDRSFFLVNGSTVGNLAMIRTVCEPGDTLLVQRNAHKSVFHALELAGAQAVYLTPEWDEKTCTAGAVSAAAVEQALEQYPNVKGVCITYPTYYGTTGTDLQAIVECAHERGIPVLVDEAHGAHFAVGAPFPSSALHYGADVVVQSAHKTLSAMTQASYLHVKSRLIDTGRLARFLSMLQTSSPSYVLLASLDDARAMIATYTDADKQAFLAWRREFIERLRKGKTLEVIETDDPLKLLLRQKEASGYTLQHSLEKQGVFPELADERQVLFVLPLLTETSCYPTETICEAIGRAVEVIQKETGHNPEKAESSDESPHGLVITTRSHPKSAARWVVAEVAVGMQAASAIIPYPPGIPIVLSGEELGWRHVQEICRMTEAGAKFQGAVRGNGPATEFEVLRPQGEDGNG